MAKSKGFTSSPKCPQCGGPMREFAGGKGFRCEKGSDKKQGAKWVSVGCPGKVWNNSQWGAKKEAVERAEDFPTLAKATEEQQAIGAWFATSPTVKGSRFLQVNAGPGSGKTTTIAASCKGLQARVGSLHNWQFLMFNTNARDVFLSKLPMAVANIFTLNGYFGGAQGYKYANYNDGKLLGRFWEQVNDLPRDERPSPSGLKGIIDRMRDILLYVDSPSDPRWLEMILATCQRFGGVAKGYTRNAETINKFLPELATWAENSASKIDLSEQYAKPAIDAIRSLKWTMPADLISRTAEWTGEHIRHFATLVKAIKLPQTNIVVDEAQDMSLPILAAVLASTYRNGELVIVGDDRHGTPEDSDYQAGQGIYGWRGAGGGMFALAKRVWEELTGETVKEVPLTVSFRNSPAIVAAYQPLNRVMKSGRTDESEGGAFNVDQSTAFDAWLACPEGKTALWITRKNATLAGMLVETIKAGKQVCLRGNGGQFVGQVKRTVENYPSDLSQFVAELGKDIAAAKAEGAEESPDSPEEFCLWLARELQASPVLLESAGIDAKRPTTAAIVAFVEYYNDRKAPRTLSTVYRCKGDEADIVIVADTESFNTAWNGDEWELDAVRHVAASRARDWLLVTGEIGGVITGTMDADNLLRTLAGE